MRNYVWPAVYIATVMIANYVGNWFVPTRFGPISLGNIPFGVTFTARDYAHRLGLRVVSLMIVIAAIGSAALSVWLGVPGRLVAASLVTILIAESADTGVYQRFIRRHWLLRVAASNAVSVPLDTVLFNVLAFGGIFPASVLAKIIVIEIVIKFMVGWVVALWRLK